MTTVGNHFCRHFCTNVRRSRAMPGRLFRFPMILFAFAVSFSTPAVGAGEFFYSRPLFAFLGWGMDVPPELRTPLLGIISISALAIAGAVVLHANRMVRRTREEAARAHKRTRALIEGTPGWTFHLDPTGELTWLSPETEKVTGYPPGEAQAMKRYPLPLVHPEDRCRIESVLSPGSGAPDQGAVSFRFVRKDGTVRSAQMIWRTVYDAETGQSAGKHFSVQDITDAVAPLRCSTEQETRYRLLFLNLPDAFVAVDMEGRIVEWNSAFEVLLGYSPEELRSLRLLDITPSDDVDLERRILADQLLPRGFSKPYQRRFIAKNGVHIPVEMRVQLTRNPDGTPAGFWALIRDIRERLEEEADKRETERRLQEVQRLQSLTRVAAGVAHDFNNLLMVILGNVEELRMAPDLPPSLQEDVQQIREAAQRATVLCRQLLAYSGSGGFQQAPSDVSQAVRDQQELIQATVGGRVTLRFETPPGLPRVKLDAKQLNQALLNLVMNAVEAVGESGGIVTIRTGACHVTAQDTRRCYPTNTLIPGDYVFVEVVDSGPGIDPDEIPHLFDPFVSTRAVGRGLGLPAVLGIARGHGGAVFVESFPGQGARFRMLFPPCGDPPLEGERPLEMESPDKAEEAFSIKGRRIMVVEDDETVRTIITRTLRTAGCYVLSVENGPSAVRAVRKDPDKLDCAIVDLVMPGLHGGHVLAELRRIRPDLPVIMMSGCGTSDIISMLEGQRADAFLTKPCSPREVIEVVGRVLLASRTNRDDVGTTL